MNNEENKVDVTEEEEESLEVDPEEFSDEDTTDWEAKAKEERDARLRERGIARRYKTKLAKLSEKKEEPIVQPKPSEPEKKEFDYGQKAYLKSNGIDQEDFAFVKEVIDATGKTLDDVLVSKYFQAEIKERKESRETAEATPSGTRRSTSSAKDSVDYWIQKGELPEDRELRQKVVNERIRKERSASVFSDRPVA